MARQSRRPPGPRPCRARRCRRRPPSGWSGSARIRRQQAWGLPQPRARSRQGYRRRRQRRRSGRPPFSEGQASGPRQKRQRPRRRTARPGRCLQCRSRLRGQIVQFAQQQRIGGGDAGCSAAAGAPGADTRCGFAGGESRPSARRLLQRRLRRMGDPAARCSAGRGQCNAGAGSAAAAEREPLRTARAPQARRRRRGSSRRRSCCEGRRRPRRGWPGTGSRQRRRGRDSRGRRGCDGGPPQWARSGPDGGGALAAAADGALGPRAIDTRDSRGGRGSRGGASAASDGRIGGVVVVRGGAVCVHGARGGGHSGNWPEAGAGARPAPRSGCRRGIVLGVGRRRRGAARQRPTGQRATRRGPP